MFVMFKHLIPNHTQSGFCISAEKFNPRPLNSTFVAVAPLSLTMTTFWAFLSKHAHQGILPSQAAPLSPGSALDEAVITLRNPQLRQRTLPVQCQ